MLQKKIIVIQAMKEALRQKTNEVKSHLLQMLKEYYNKKSWQDIGGIMIMKIALPIIIGVLVLFLWDCVSAIKPEKIEIYLPYAYEYKYQNGKSYGNATTQSGNQSRDIERNRLIPYELNANSSVMKLTLGIRNQNIKSLQNPSLYLRIPKDVEVVQSEHWVKYSEKEYYLQMNDFINNGIGKNLPQPIYVKFNTKGKHEFYYYISGLDIKRIDRSFQVEVY